MTLVIGVALVIALWLSVAAGRWIWTWLPSPDYPPAVSVSDSRPPHSGDH